MIQIASAAIFHPSRAVIMSKFPKSLFPGIPLVALFLAGGMPAGGNQTPHLATLTLVNDANLNKIDVTFTPKWALNPGPRTQTTTVSGTLQAGFNVNPPTGASEVIFFTGAGTVSNTDMRFQRSGFLQIGYDISLAGMSGNINSYGIVRAMNPATGDFDAGNHRYSVTSGSATGQVGGGLQTVNESFTPQNPLDIQGQGTGNVQLTLLSQGGGFSNYAVTMTLPVNGIYEDNDEYRISGAGTLKATGTLSVPRGPTVWTGGAGDNNWATAGNWDNGAPVDGDTLVFTGTNATYTNNTPAGGSYAIQFASGASGLTLAGHAVTLGGALGNANPITIQLPFIGGGGLAKSGAGTLTLSAANTYTGTTTINGGAIRIAGGANRLPAASAATLANTAGVALDLNGHNQELRSLAGGGASGGTVANSGAGAPALTLRPAGTDNITFSGLIGGNIRLEIAGNKVEPLFSAPRQRLANTGNTFSGGVLIDGGTLMARQDGSLGAVPAAFEPARITLRNNGTLVNEATGQPLAIHANRGITLDAGGGALVAGFTTNVTVNSVISGAAGNHLTIMANSGTVVLTGNNTYAGDTILKGPDAFGTGRLQIGNGGASGSLGAGDVVNGGQLTFHRSGTYQYAGEISGAGQVIQSGGGTTILTGAHTYGGATTVSAGTLVVNGSLGAASAVAVNGGTLGGSGVIGGSVTVAAGANLAPGGSVGTLGIGGGLNLAALAGGAGRLFYELGPIAASDRIAVTGTLAIGAGALGLSDFALSVAGGLEPGVYTLVSSGNLSGSLDPSDLVGAIGEFRVTLGTSGPDIILTVAPGRTPYELWAGDEAFGGDANGDGVGNGIAFLLGAPDPDADARGLLPAAARTGGGLVLAFNCLPAAGRGDAALNLQFGNDLVQPGAWTSVPVPGAPGESTMGGVSFTATANGGLIRVEATIPAIGEAAGTFFARLQAVNP
jgi:autotransporter-associated beta strand protein